MITVDEFISIGKKYGINVKEIPNLIYYSYNENEDFIMCSYDKKTNTIELSYDFKYNPYSECLLGQSQYNFNNIDTSIKFEKKLSKALKEYKKKLLQYKMEQNMKKIEKDF